MELDKIKELNLEELKATIIEEEARLESLRYNNVISRVENPAKIRYIKRTIARLKTIYSQKLKQG
ncbi:MAG: 50S ribosomal protein L29 [Candidatus Omnitrophica bacterium]|nr:50S ribosomal protein L29 [Candidatus Omnitrophota bacterium]